MRNAGVTKSIARQRIAVGCNWMCVPGFTAYFAGLSTEFRALVVEWFLKGM